MGEVAGAGGVGASEDVEAVAGLVVVGATPAASPAPLGGGALDGVLGTEVAGIAGISIVRAHDAGAPVVLMTAPAPLRRIAASLCICWVMDQ